MQKDVNNVFMRNAQDSLLFSVFYSYYCRFNKIDIRNQLCAKLDREVINDGRKSFTTNVEKVVDDEMEKV